MGETPDNIIDVYLYSVNSTGEFIGVARIFAAGRGGGALYFYFTR